mmetsp:Transcript_13714/g.38322  ORF Transcript_13714/g.38322 Transcript_13714/m.38322 type:complete len:147 (-) Transcript_13714:103-543(-)
MTGPGGVTNKPSPHQTREETQEVTQEDVKYRVTLHALQYDLNCHASKTQLKSLRWKFGEPHGAYIMHFGRKFENGKWDAKIDDQLRSINGVDCTCLNKQEILQVYRDQQDGCKYFRIQVARLHGAPVPVCQPASPRLLNEAKFPDL